MGFNLAFKGLISNCTTIFYLLGHHQVLVLYKYIKEFRVHNDKNVRRCDNIFCRRVRKTAEGDY
jgi:hypothetical protein